jgi:hypothetical protein
MFKVRYIFKIVDKVFDFFKMSSQGDTRRIIKLAIALAMTIHLMACIDVFVGRSIYQNNLGWILEYGLTNKSTGEFKMFASFDPKYFCTGENCIVYTTAVYFATVTISTVGYGDLVLFLMFYCIEPNE